MKKVAVVSAFVPLKVKHMQADEYQKLGDEMLVAAQEAGAVLAPFLGYSLDMCWSYNLCKDLPPATGTPSDRYETPQDHINSHIVQHTRTQWALRAVELNPDVETVIWLDLGILKQGKHTGKTFTPEHVSAFVEKVAKYENDDIPFPGIEDKKPINPFGDNWRFCGSTHIWPVKYLEDIHRSYKANLINFVRKYKKVPLDLAIWPLVEQNSGLPFKWYKAEYDHTQLTEFP